MKIDKEEYSGLLNERIQLAERLEGLSLFLKNKEKYSLIDTEHLALMCTQQDIMGEYLDVLNQRAKLIKDEIKED